MTKTINPTKATLSVFPRHVLRTYAKDLNVKVGKDKSDTIKNLIRSHKVKINIDLEV